MNGSAFFLSFKQKSMKLFLKLFSVLITINIGIFSLSSCTEDWEESYLQVDQKTINASNSGETVTIPIETNSSWKVVKRNADWVTPDKASGTGDTQLQLTISPNTSNSRNGVITIVAGTEIAEIEIEQSASTSGKLSVTTGSCTITRTKTGTKYKYTITAQYTVSGGHLASETGVSFNGAKSSAIAPIKDGTHTATIYVTSSNSSYSVNYQAYGIKKSNGTYVYGSSKTKKI